VAEELRPASWVALEGADAFLDFPAYGRYRTVTLEA